VASENRRCARVLRVAYIDQVSELGGAEHLLLTLLSGIAQAGISPILICCQDGPLPNQARRRGIRTLIVPLPRFASLSSIVRTVKIPNPFAAFWNCLSLVRSARIMRSVFQAEGVDLVQTNSAFSHIYGGIAARLTNIPCVWYLHDLVETKRLLGAVAFIWRVLARLLATKVVADSKAAASGLSLGSGCTVIYAGISACQRGQINEASRDIGFRARLRLRDDAILVGYVGRISYVKGLDNLIRAAEQVIAVNNRVHFLIVGEGLGGESEYMAYLAAMVDRGRLRHRWHWLGYDPQASLKMAELDLLVLPSRRECFGLVLQEAGLAGKAVVATRVGGIPEVVVDGETGILVPPDNPKELASALVRLINDPGEAHKMGCRARERITSLFSLPRYYLQFEQLYRTLAGIGLTSTEKP
jgi:glycosyltransferase involved in cell wall biosynthesis